MGRALMIILVFVIIGPLIGLVAASALLTMATSVQRESVAVLDKSVETADPAAFGLLILVYGLLFAHFIGAMWAALAGGIVALRAALWGPASVFEGVPIGAFTALASIVYFQGSEIDAGSLERIEVQVAAGWALVHIIPAMTCIGLTRRWQSVCSRTS